VRGPGKGVDQTRKKIVENKEKVKKNMQLPYLVSNIVEIVDPTLEDMEEDGATADINAARKEQAAVIKTTTRQVLPSFMYRLFTSRSSASLKRTKSVQATSLASTKTPSSSMRSCQRSMMRG
jgi:hypothetical protein